MTPLPMVREGSCQPDVCGSACCTLALLDANPLYRQDADLTAWLGLHGITLSEHAGHTLARVPLRCTALGDDGRCTLYGRPERPALCSAFPMSPDSLVGLGGACTYTFREGA
jgi:Fe-S-cluster containining protein